MTVKQQKLIKTGEFKTLELNLILAAARSQGSYTKLTILLDTTSAQNDEINQEWLADNKNMCAAYNMLTNEMTSIGIPFHQAADHADYVRGRGFSLGIEIVERAKI